MMASRRINEDIARYKQKIGCIIEIPNIGTGTLKFVGLVDSKAGYYVGVDLLDGSGKNNGTFNGRRYFNTDHPRSGLFIQLPKVAQIIDEAPMRDSNSVLSSPMMAQQSNDKTRNIRNSSRRSTLAPRGNHEPRDLYATDSAITNNKRVNSTGSVERVPMRRSLHDNRTPMGHTINDNGTRTPTPNRNFPVSSNRNNHDMDVDMDIDTPERNVQNINQQQSSGNVQVIKEYELKFEKQNRKLLEYERLLNDQRIVLEEIQPTIDEYDKRVNDLETERNELHNKLQETQLDFDKQLKYFETENKQLTEVVSQLHDDLRANEEYMQQQQTQIQAAAATATATANTTDGVNVEELQTQLEILSQYKKDMENAKVKWNKERDQLKMHNESLSKEYQNLNKEYMMSLSSISNNDNNNNNNGNDITNEELKKENDTLKNELQSLKDKISSMEREQQAQQNESSSLPPYNPPTKIDASAGRSLWCSLCEKSGHDQVDCPFQYEQANRPYVNNNGSITTTTTTTNIAMDGVNEDTPMTDQQYY